MAVHSLNAGSLLFMFAFIVFFLHLLRPIVPHNEVMQICFDHKEQN